MNSSTPADTSPLAASPALPALHTGTLDAEQVNQLLDDIEACTELVEILPKHAARGQVSDTAAVSLAEARTLLAMRAVRGMQLRYRHDGADWWDTLMLVGDQYRVVRIRHEFGSALLQS